VVLAIFVILTPLSVRWGWPWQVSAALLFAVIALLLVVGQTIIFLLRLVAADRRGRRRPLASETRTVGELEDAAETGTLPETATPPEIATPPAQDGPADATEPEGPVRQ
jgi:hypothetical protein